MQAQRGNILFLILLAVVLFVALSYAVTSGMRGGGNNASKESLQATVAQLHNNTMAIRSALLRMTTVGGYQPWQIDFYKSGISNSATNTTCASSACKLYDPAGGGIGGYTIPSSLWQDVSACAAVNDANGVANPGGAPPSDTASGNQYQGVLTQEYNINQSFGLGDTAPDVAGKQMFCTVQTSGCNYLWSILIER